MSQLTMSMKCKHWKSISLLHAALEAKKMLLVKNSIPKQHGENQIEKLGYTLHTVGALSFKTCHRSFSLENAVSLTSSHAAEACRITMTQECPSPTRKSPQSNSSLGEGKPEKRRGWWGGTKKKKGNLITPGHGSSTSQQGEIHHLQDQTETCAQGKAQWKLYPPI